GGGKKGLDKRWITRGYGGRVDPRASGPDCPRRRRQLMLRARLSEPDDQASAPSNPNGPARHCWFLQCLRASLRQRKRVAGYSHGPQEAAAHESIDAARELTLCETHKIRVVEKVRQRQIAAGTGPLQLLNTNHTDPPAPP